MPEDVGNKTTDHILQGIPTKMEIMQRLSQLNPIFLLP